MILIHTQTRKVSRPGSDTGIPIGTPSSTGTRRGEGVGRDSNQSCENRRQQLRKGRGMSGECPGKGTDKPIKDSTSVNPASQTMR